MPLSCRVSHPMAASLFLFVTLCIHIVFAAASVVLADLPSPAWKSNCESPFSHCADVETYESWSRAAGRVKFQVSARFMDYEKGTTVWFVGDYYNDDLFHMATETGLNMVWVRPRGSPGSTPALVCERASLDKYCRPTKKCTEVFSEANADIFSIENAARDLEWVIHKLNQKDKRLTVLGEGFGSAVAMRYMANCANSSDALLLNPVHPGLYNHFFGMWEGYDAAMQTLLHLCDENTFCSSRLGATEGAWQRLLNVLSAAKKKHLPCQRELGWGSGDTFELNLRHLLAAMLLPPQSTFTPADPGLVSLIPAFIYRLQRCNKEDVTALKTLWRKMFDTEIKECPSSVAVRSFWLVNELTPDNYKTSKGMVPSANTLINAARSSRVIIPEDSAINAFVEFYNAVPKYERRAESTKILYTRSKVLVIAADLDPLLPLAHTNNLAITYSDGNTQFRHPVGRAVHLSSAGALYHCLKNNLVQFHKDGQWAAPSACYETMVSNDRGVDFAAGDPALYFSSKETWAFTVPNPAEPPEGRLIPESRQAVVWRVLKRIFWALFWLFLVAAVLGGGYVAYTRYSFRSGHISDNFYDNLRR